MGRNSTPLVCFAETMVLYYEMIQIIEMFETTDHFVKQTPHTLYLTLEKLNDRSVHFAKKAALQKIRNDCSMFRKRAV